MCLHTKKASQLANDAMVVAAKAEKHLCLDPQAHIPNPTADQAEEQRVKYNVQQGLAPTPTPSEDAEVYTALKSSVDEAQAAEEQVLEQVDKMARGQPGL